MPKLARVLLGFLCISLLASCTVGRKPASSNANSEGKVVATYPAKYGNTFHLYDGDCAYYKSAKKFPRNYVLMSPGGSVIQKGCYSFNQDTLIATVDDQDGTTLDFTKQPKTQQSSLTPRSVESTTQSQRASRNTTKEPPQNKQPVALTVSPLTVTSEPAGAKVMTESGEVLGVTPAVISFSYRPESADSNGCYKSPNKIKLVWQSGAELLSSSKTMLCMKNGRFSLNIKRPKVPGLEIDIDYVHKQEMLKVQQEQLRLQRQQAEEQRRFMAEQSAHAAAQEKAANEAMLMQAYQMMQPKPSGTRLPINCDRSLVSGSYSCY